MKTKSLLNLLLIAFSLAFSTHAQILDPSFGENGISTNELVSSTLKTTVLNTFVQEDGKIVISQVNDLQGTYLYNFVRLTENGSIDTSFGSKGIQSDVFSLLVGPTVSELFQFTKLLPLPDGSFMYVWGDNEINFSKFTSDGRQDTSFGFNGRFSRSVGQRIPSGVEAAAVVDDGILVAYLEVRDSFNFDKEIDLKIIKFDFNGDRDRSFGTNGEFVQTSFQGDIRFFERFIDDMRITKDGAIIVKSTTFRRSLNTGLFRNFLYKVSPTGQLLNVYSGSIASFSEFPSNEYTINENGEIYFLQEGKSIIKLDSDLKEIPSFTASIPANLGINPRERRITVTNQNLITVSGIEDNTLYFMQVDSMGVQQTDFGMNGIGTVILNPAENEVTKERPTVDSNTELLSQVNKVVGVYTAGAQTFALRLKDANELPTPADFNLIDGSANSVITSLETDRKYLINLFKNDYLNFQLNADIDEDSKSYKLTLEGPVTFSRIENAAPYALFGDTNGDYFGKPLLEGTYTLSATPFSERDAKGMKGAIKTITFEIVDTAPRITDVLLSTFNPNGTLLSDTSLEPGSSIIEPQGTTFSIEALANRFTSSVRLELTGGPNDISRLENVSPFALFGDLSGIFNQEALAPGTYVFSATPYTQQLARGFEGPTKVISFTVENMPTPNSIVIAPNPIQGSEINLTFDTTNASNIVSYEVVDLTGRNILSGAIRLRAGQKTYSISTSEIDMKPGVYTLRMNNTTYSLIK